MTNPNPDNVLTAAERAWGQRAASRANLLVFCTNTIVAGTVMMLYATDVMGCSGKKIGAILAFAPLAALLRIPLLKFASRLGLVQTLRWSAAVNVGVVLALAAIPARWLPYAVFLGLLVVFSGVNQLGLGMAWQPLLRDITTVADRGRFFARMRFHFSVVTSVVLGIIPFAVGERMTEGVYKVLLLFAAFGLVNFWFWVGQVPEAAGGERGGGMGARFDSWRRLWDVIRESPLLRVPLAINLLLALGGMPLFVVYLRQLLHYPSDLVAAYIFVFNTAAALSLLVWGRVADAVGARPMLVGLLAVSIVLTPLNVLLAPAAPGAVLAAIPWLTVVLLMLLALAGGVLSAGIGIAITSIQHFHVRPRDSVESLNLYALAVLTGAALNSVAVGWLLDDWALPRGVIPLVDGRLSFDIIKGFLLFGTLPLLTIALLLCGRLPSMRAHFGLADFFSSLSPDAMRTMLIEKNVYHESDDKRAGTAYWLGAHSGPLAIDPLADMLTDPSYDVKVEAVRGLARTGSPLAGERLLALLENEEKRQLADHVAWALGELRHAPAFDALVRRLAPSYSARIRAMAARALGKLGDPRAIAPIVDLLKSERDSQHAITSACWALLRLRAYEHVGLVFDTLQRLTDREERFELMDNLCEPLEISSEWLLRYTDRSHAFEALDQYVAHRSPAWRERHRAVIEAFHARDAAAIQRAFEEAQVRPPWAGRPILREMARSLAVTRTWQPLSILASAWLLLRPRE